MIIQENISLAPHTTFKIGGPARFFCRVSNEDELVEAVKFAKDKKIPIFVIGGGSNVLVNDKGFDGLVIKMEIGGIEKIHDSRFKIQDEGKREAVDNSKKVIISVAAGEVWDDFVAYAVGQGLYGIENLSAIPGTVGASPVQNIGAYGMDVSQTIYTVRALDKESMNFVEFSNEECLFSYRESVFKKNKGRYIVTRVDFVLDREGKVNTEYKEVGDYFRNKNLTASPTLGEVREAIIDIRRNKLPDWKVWGTAGSFFKNPIISAEQFAKLAEKYPGVPGFPGSDGLVKVSLGWILDKVCNVRGRRVGKAQVYGKQALVLVAEPGATSEEVVILAKELMNCVKEKTGITIEGEVEWVN